MATPQDMMTACEAASSFGYTGIALVYRPENNEELHEIGSTIRLVKDKGPLGEVVEARELGDRVEYLVIYDVEQLRAWLFHYMNGELFHQ